MQNVFVDLSEGTGNQHYLLLKLKTMKHKHPLRTVSILSFLLALLTSQFIDLKIKINKTTTMFTVIYAYFTCFFKNVKEMNKNSCFVTPKSVLCPDLNDQLQTVRFANPLRAL